VNIFSLYIFYPCVLLLLVVVIELDTEKKSGGKEKEANCG
jgi:hypothetical protein